MCVRHELEEFAKTCIKYELARDVTLDKPEDQKLLTDEYKTTTVQKMTPEQLVDIIMTQPTVIIEKPEDHHLVSHKVIMEPLTNLTFCRDQQITTGAGIVIGCMKMVQRVCSHYFFSC